MSMSVGENDGDAMCDINTTPLIDVMLVLLIMLILTLPIMNHAVKLDMPNPTHQSAAATGPARGHRSGDLFGRHHHLGRQHGAEHRDAGRLLPALRRSRIRSRKFICVLIGAPATKSLPRCWRPHSATT